MATARRWYSQDLRDCIVYKWRKEKPGYKKISKHLCIPRDSVRSIIIFYKKHGQVWYHSAVDALGEPTTASIAASCVK
jgi:hypothetical protein